MPMPKLLRALRSGVQLFARWRLASDAMCVENTFETGGVGAMHCHPHTQITYIVSGRYRFTIGDETREVGPGDTLLKQNGVMHGCVCLEGGVMLILLYAGGLLYNTAHRREKLEGEPLL